MKYSKGDFTIVPNKSVRSGMPPNLQVVLMWLADHSDDNEQCYPSRKTLARECGMTVRTLDRVIAALIELGIVKKTPRFIGNHKTSNMYEVGMVDIGVNAVPPYVTFTQGGDKNDTRGGDKNDTRVATKTTHRTQYIEPNPERTLIEPEDSIGEIAKSDELVSYGSPAINEMFNVWESHVGYSITSKRQANRNACSNLIKKHGSDGVTKLIKGVAKAQQDKYAPRITDFCTLQARLNDLLAWGNSTIKAKKTIRRI